jgi:uncharacterized cupin superfamily protein
VSLKKVNLLTVELDEPLDEAGFRHVAASVGPRLGARRIGASVYRAEAGVPIWPYHYHHGIEEWLYVVAGAPVLREPAGERTLAPGDLVCFPSGHRGAHTMQGPGRFAIFDAGRDVEPWMSVYPDSDKVGGPEGILLRGSAVSYWHGEGGPSEPVEIVREPEVSPPQPVVNVLSHLGAANLGERLGATVMELEPGAGSEPYHYVHGREEWLLVLAGAPTLRHADGEDRLEPGDLVCFLEGPAGARELLNRVDSLARARPVDDGRAGERLLPRHRALADAQRARRFELDERGVERLEPDAPIEARAHLGGSEPGGARAQLEPGAGREPRERIAEAAPARVLDRRHVEHAGDPVADERHRAGHRLMARVGDERRDVRGEDRPVVEEQWRPLALAGVVVGERHHTAVVDDRLLVRDRAHLDLGGHVGRGRRGGERHRLLDPAGAEALRERGALDVGVLGSPDEDDAGVACEELDGPGHDRGALHTRVGP